MTNDQFIALAIVAGIAAAVALAVVIVARVRRRRERRTRAAGGLLQAESQEPATVTGQSSQPRVVLGPSRPIAQVPGQATGTAPVRGQPLQLPVVLSSPRPIVLAPGQAPAPRPVRRGLPLVIPRQEDPLWQEKGWRRNGRGYEGSYRAGRHRWRGLITEPYQGSFDAYIWDPPLAELGRRTSHRPCFSLSGMDGRFKIHYHTMPAHVDHAIASVEAVLGQAMGV